MHIYVCLETILKNNNIIPIIKEYYKSGNHITIACTKLFRSKHTQEDIEKLLEPLKNFYDILSFLKPDYDKIIDEKISDISINQSINENINIKIKQ